MPDRNEVKRFLLKYRDQVCPLCGASPTDMHEVILSRAEARGTRIRRDLLFTRFNCVVLCHKCHMQYATIKRKQLLFYLVDAEGKENIISWLNRIKNNFKSNIILEKIDMVKYVRTMDWIDYKKEKPRRSGDYELKVKYKGGILCYFVNYNKILNNWLMTPDDIIIAWKDITT